MNDQTAAPDTELVIVQRNVRWLRMATTLGLAASLLLSWRLWLTSRDYPLAPVWDLLPQPSYPYDAILLGVMVASLLGAAFVRRPKLFLLPSIAIGALLAVLDQSRWQPWTIHFMVFLVALLLCAGSQGRKSKDVQLALVPIGLLVVFTYIYSGLHKLNAEFTNWIFPDMMLRPLKWIGIEAATWPKRVVIALALGAAAGEIAAGALLLFRRTQRAAAIALIAMHAWILLLIGPLVHNWNAVVWPWNILMIIALWRLFCRRGGGNAGGTDHVARAVQSIIARVKGRARPDAINMPAAIMTVAVTILFGALPALSFLDLWDSYPSFSLYSGDLRTARLIIAPDDVPRLPASARAVIDQRSTVSLLAWSMHELGTSWYPEQRVALRVAGEVSRCCDLPVTLRLGSKPNRLTGERQYRYYHVSPQASATIDDAAWPSELGRLKGDAKDR